MIMSSDSVKSEFDIFPSTINIFYNHKNAITCTDLPLNLSLH